MFQSSLPPKEERFANPIVGDTANLWFQSSLPPKEERFKIDGTYDPEEESFNPRSPRRRSASCLTGDDRGIKRVSILAPPEGGALQCIS